MYFADGLSHQRFGLKAVRITCDKGAQMMFPRCCIWAEYEEVFYNRDGKIVKRAAHVLRVIKRRLCRNARSCDTIRQPATIGGERENPWESTGKMMQDNLFKKFLGEGLSDVCDTKNLVRV